MNMDQNWDSIFYTKYCQMDKSGLVEKKHGHFGHNTDELMDSENHVFPDWDAD